ncbi:unnamed protein product [Alternaria alternata]
MKALLYACPRLTVFKLIIPDGRRHDCMMWDVAYQPLVCPRDMVKALLENHRRILETLHLDFRYYYDLGDPGFQQDLWETGVGPDDYICPSFRDFEHLSHLTIEFEKLAKLGDLPVSLKLLKLQRCQFADLDATYLQDLARLKETWCPVIEHVENSGTCDCLGSTAPRVNGWTAPSIPERGVPFRDSKNGSLRLKSAMT